MTPNTLKKTYENVFEVVNRILNYGFNDNDKTHLKHNLIKNLV